MELEGTGTVTHSLVERSLERFGIKVLVALLEQHITVRSE